MRRSAVILSALLSCGPGIAWANPGPCTKDIAAFEQAIAANAHNPEAGPRAPQTTAAQLGHQPTQATIKEAEDAAHARFASSMARAKTLDAEGRSSCEQALAEAKAMYNLPPAFPRSTASEPPARKPSRTPF